MQYLTQKSWKASPILDVLCPHTCHQLPGHQLGQTGSVPPLLPASLTTAPSTLAFCTLTLIPPSGLNLSLGPLCEYCFLPYPSLTKAVFMQVHYFVGILLLLLCFIYLFEMESNRESEMQKVKEREIFYLMVHFPDSHNSQV